MKISEKQFDYAYKEYAKELLYIAYGYTRNKEDSIDIMQNAYVALLESNKKFESNEHIKYFLIRVTINESINFVKSYFHKKVINNNDYVINSVEILTATSANIPTGLTITKEQSFLQLNYVKKDVASGGGD